MTEKEVELTTVNRPHPNDAALVTRDGYSARSIECEGEYVVPEFLEDGGFAVVEIEKHQTTSYLIGQGLHHEDATSIRADVEVRDSPFIERLALPGFDVPTVQSRIARREKVTFRCELEVVGIQEFVDLENRSLLTCRRVPDADLSLRRKEHAARRCCQPAIVAERDPPDLVGESREGGRWLLLE